MYVFCSVSDPDPYPDPDPPGSANFSAEDPDPDPPKFGGSRIRIQGMKNPNFRVSKE